MADKQTVSDAKITQLGVKFSAFKDKVTTATAGLTNIAVEPGDFEDANVLKTTVNERKAQVQKNADNIGAAFVTIGDGLKAVAKVYLDTENDNTVEASELNTLIDNTDAKIPGIKE